MRKMARLFILLVLLAVFLVATGLHKRMKEPVIHGPVIGIVLGFTAGSPKKAFFSGIFWRVLMPLYQVIVEYATEDVFLVYRTALADIQTSLLVVLFCVFGGVLKRLTD